MRGEIRKIVRASPGPTELLVRVTGDEYDPDETATYVHMRVRDVLGRTQARGLGPGATVMGLVAMTTRWLEESERPRRTLEVNGRRGSGRIPRAARLVGHDHVIAGQVLRDLSDDAFVLDAGIPILVRTPDFPPGAHPAGRWVEFLLQEPAEAHFV